MQCNNRINDIVSVLTLYCEPGLSTSKAISFANPVWCPYIRPPLGPCNAMRAFETASSQSTREKPYFLIPITANPPMIAKFCVPSLAFAQGSDGDFAGAIRFRVFTTFATALYAGTCCAVTNRESTSITPFFRYPPMSGTLK